MKIEWDPVGEKTWEVGCDKGVLYKPDKNNKYVGGVPWNGLSAVNENPSGAEPSKIYANNATYGTMMSTEEYGGTIEAYAFPEGFRECDGSKEIAPGVYAGQQGRKSFGMTYRTLIGNDTQGTDYGYTIHIFYGAMASPSTKDHSTVNENVEASTMSWEFSCTPVPVPGHKPTCNLDLVSTTMTPEHLASLEAILYGTDSDEPRLPLPAEIIELFGAEVVG